MEVKLKEKRQVFLIGGGNTYDSYHDYLRDLKKKKLDFSRLTQKRWKDSFARKVGTAFEVVQPRMPNSDNAKYAEWVISFRKLIPFMRDGVILIGHSLGGIFLAKYLASHRFPRRIKATILIAAPFTADDMDESLGDFTLPISLRRFARQGGDIFLYQSEDDPVVPASHVRLYQLALPSATARMFNKKGHFNQATFPELVLEVQLLNLK